MLVAFGPPARALEPSVLADPGCEPPPTVDLLCDHVYGGRWDAVAQALASGLNVNTPTSIGASVLHLAASQHGGHEGVVGLLLAAGANANARTCLGATPLHWAVESSTVGVCLALLRYGANPNARDNYGATPLIVVARYGEGDSLERARVLLACPDLDLRPVFAGRTAEQWARQRGRLLIADSIAHEVCVWLKAQLGGRGVPREDLRWCRRRLAPGARVWGCVVRACVRACVCACVGVLWVVVGVRAQAVLGARGQGVPVLCARAVHACVCAQWTGAGRSLLYG